MTERFTSAGEADTLAIARAFARTLRPGDIVSLAGDLGAGKTVFARGVLGELGAPGEVTSPTFTLIHEHAGREFPVHHMDFYRLEDPDQILDIGVEDLFGGPGVCLVEWAGNMGALFPEEAIEVAIAFTGGTNREITIHRKETPCDEPVR